MTFSTSFWFILANYFRIIDFFFCCFFDINFECHFIEYMYFTSGLGSKKKKERVRYVECILLRLIGSCKTCTVDFILGGRILKGICYCGSSTKFWFCEDYNRRNLLPPQFFSYIHWQLSPWLYEKQLRILICEDRKTKILEWNNNNSKKLNSYCFSLLYCSMKILRLCFGF